MKKTYTDPSTVISPLWAKIKIEEVIVDTGYNGFSVVKLWYEDHLRIGIRWNGTEKYIGMPSSRGNPTWFMLPDEFMDDIELKSRELITDKVDKLAGLIKKEVNVNKSLNKNDFMAHLSTDIELNETEKNELKTILEKEKIYFPSPDMCGVTSNVNGLYDYNVFYVI